jgi:tetratricopeptide (TPR) repeat protein
VELEAIPGLRRVDGQVVQKARDFALRDDKGAVADLDEAVRLDPRAAGAYWCRGLCWCEKGRFDRAIADFEEATRIEPAGAGAHYYLAVAFLASRRDGASQDPGRC